MTITKFGGGGSKKELLPWEVDRNAIGIVSKQLSNISSNIHTECHYCYDEYSDRIFGMNSGGSVAFDEFDGTTFKLLDGYTQSSQTGNLYHVSCAVRRGKYVYGFSGKSSASFAYITQYDTEAGTKSFILLSDLMDEPYSASTGGTTVFEATNKNYVYIRQHDSSNNDRFYRIEFDDNGVMVGATNMNMLLTGATANQCNYAVPGVIKRIHNSNEHFFAFSLSGYSKKWICGVCDLSLENPVKWKTEGSTLSPFATNSDISNLFIYKHHISGEYYSVFTDSNARAVKLRHFNTSGVISDVTLTTTTASQYVPQWFGGKVYKNVALITEVLGSSTDQSQSFFAKINNDGTWEFLVEGSENQDAYNRMGSDSSYKYPYSTVGYAMYNQIANMSDTNYPHTESADGRLRFIELYGSNWVAPAFVQMAIKAKEDK